MKEDIKIKNGNLIITVPLKTTRSNPYDPDLFCEMDNIVGLIEGENDMGFCYRIDMDYKGKDDQWKEYFYKYLGDRKSFEKLCKKLGVDLVYDYHGTIYNEDIE